MLKVTVDPLAIEDIAEASKFYNRERPGLGKIFRKYIKAAFKKIAGQPELYNKTLSRALHGKVSLYRLLS